MEVSAGRAGLSCKHASRHGMQMSIVAEWGCPERKCQTNIFKHNLYTINAMVEWAGNVSTGGSVSMQRQRGFEGSWQLRSHCLG